MIPQRIKLSGFLCYLDEQEVEFDGNSTLWMLSGLNGSGKSSIFDALTYALFGHHRGGGQHAHELINKDSERLNVEFDFLLDNRLYRAKRTLRRKTGGGAAGTQQMFRLNSEEGEAQSWLPLEGTGGKKEFDVWVEENIGLNYETFTSSVLLLQGKAEKLLDSKPEGRREVLASIVDLERYEKLHERADEQRKRFVGSLKLLQDRLATLPAVSEEEQAAAQQRIVDAEQAREGAEAAVDRWRNLESQAREWSSLQARLALSRQRWQQAEALLKEASGIEKAMLRLQELRATLPHLKRVSDQRSEIHQAQVRGNDLTKQRQKLHDQLDDTENALKQTRMKREATQRLLEQDERQEKAHNTRLLDCTARLEKLKEYERQEGELSRIQAELKGLPDDPLEGVRAARTRVEQLTNVTQTVKLLERFQSKRESLRQAQARECAAQTAHQRVMQQGLEAKAESEKLRPQLDEASRQVRSATEEATAAKALLQQARISLGEVMELGGSHICRACGQPLTPQHLADEKRRRSATVLQSEKKAKATQQSQDAAVAVEQQAREQYRLVEQKLVEAREAFLSGKKDLEQTQDEVTRSRKDCAQTWEDLPEAQRARVSPTATADWLATTYPTETELNEVRAEASQLPVAQRQLQAAEKQQEQWTRSKTQESTLLTTLQRLQSGLPVDRDSVRREHTDLQTGMASLLKSLTGHRAALKENERELDRLSRDRDKTHQQWVEATGLIKQQEDIQRRAEEGVATTLKLLPASWRDQPTKFGMAELSQWTKELRDLETSRAEERGKELQHARHNLEVLERDYRVEEQQEQGYPPEARQEISLLQKELSEAKARNRASENTLSEAKQQLALLENSLLERRKLEAEYLQTEGELATQRLLSELLGRERLQLYLVRQAERQVVEHANAVLDRLSGGSLYLKLSGVADGEGGSAKALELEAYNRSTGEKPINVAFLSGSQKFRVAVSLALGIGQYASRQHRPIESVIIDEGFGCLDNQGRQVMIQELQNLRGQMRCILLVSHQEDFAEAFPDGYHFRLEEGATRVSRFQR